MGAGSGEGARARKNTHDFIISLIPPPEIEYSYSHIIIIISGSLSLSLSHSQFIISLLTVLSTIRTAMASSHEYESESPLIENSGMGMWHKCLQPTAYMTNAQRNWVYKQTFVAILLSFGVTFGLTYYTIAGGPSPNLFELCSNYFLTCFFTSLLNWNITSAAMNLEVLSGIVAPLNPKNVAQWPSKEASWYSWLMNTSEIIAPAGNSWCCSRFVVHNARLIPWLAYGYVGHFPVYCAITWIFYQYFSFNDFPDAQIAISTYSSLVSAATIPLWAYITLGRLGDLYLCQKYPTTA